jgi:Holliday junction resolvasome RuvABC DNA-binding subunit
VRWSRSGYKPSEVVKMLKSAARDGATTEDLIRRALQAVAG